MKKLLLISLLTGTVAAYAQTNYPGGIPGCIARWDFAQSPGPVTSVLDVSGNGNNSSSVNSLFSSIGFRNVANKAMVFNGFNSSAIIPHTSLLQPTAITMVSLVRFNGFYTGTCQGNTIVTKDQDNQVGNYSLLVSDNVFDGSCVTVSPSNKQFYGVYSTVNVNNSLAAGNYLSTGQWYFLASSYDGTTVRHYQVLMDPANYVSAVAPFYTANVPGSIGTNSANVMLGRSPSTLYPFPFNGFMDEVALFNRALTNTEIQSVYDYLWGIVAITSVPTTLCSGQSFNVAYTVNNTSFFSATNTFTVQLSNAGGSFAAPTNIGSVTATGGGTIPCVVPGSIATGTGYRIRIVANNVAYTTRDNAANITITNLTNPSASSNTPVCEGNTLNLTGTSSTPGVTYHWNGPGLSSNSQNPVIPNVTLAHAGKYTLYTTLNGCTSQTDTETVVISSNIPPVVTSYVSPDDTICVGGTAAFYALVTSGANPQYQWMKNGVPIPGETANTFVSTTLSTGDVITCQVTSSGCSSTLFSTSNPHTMTVVNKSPVEVNLTADPGTTLSPWQMVTFTANVTNGGLSPTYQWKLNGNDILGATGKTWSANNLNNNNAVAVVVNSSSDCALPATATSQAVVVNIKTSVQSLENNHQLHIYPNPGNGEFVIERNGNFTTSLSIEVLNAMGQLVHKQTYFGHEQNIPVNLYHLSNGVYLIKLTTGEQNFHSRLVIDK